MASDPKPTLGKKKKAQTSTRKPLGVAGPTRTTPGYLAPTGYYDVNGAPANTGYGFITPQGLAASPATRGQTFFPQGVPPRYFAGDEWAPFNLPATSADGNDISTIQHQLRTAGFLKGKYQVGAFDPTTQNAYKAALVAANKAGVSYGDIIAAGSQGLGQANAGGGGSQAQLQITLTDPTVLKQAVQAVAFKLLGNYLPDDQANTFVQSYQAAQTANKTDVFGNRQTGGTATNTPTPDEAAQMFVTTKFPSQVAGSQVGENFAKFQQMLTQSLPGGESQASR